MTTLKDFQKAWIIYQYYKKGKAEMDKIKEFVTTHKNEIILASVAIVAYRIGFKKGMKTTENAVTHLFDEASKVVMGVK